MEELAEHVLRVQPLERCGETHDGDVGLLGIVHHGPARACRCLRRDTVEINAERLIRRRA